MAYGSLQATEAMANDPFRLDTSHTRNEDKLTMKMSVHPSDVYEEGEGLLGDVILR